AHESAMRTAGKAQPATPQRTKKTSPITKRPRQYTTSCPALLRTVTPNISAHHSRMVSHTANPPSIAPPGRTREGALRGRGAPLARVPEPMPRPLRLCVTQQVDYGREPRSPDEGPSVPALIPSTTTGSLCST